MRDLWQLHCQILLIILKKEFIKLNVKIVIVFFNLKVSKNIQCNKDYSNKIDEELKKRFRNTFKFYNNDINKFILLFKKGVSTYEYMHEWEKFNEPSLPEKEEFYSNLNMKDITDSDYLHLKRVCKVFEIKKIGEYHDLYLKNDKLLLADVFENFREMCFKISHLYPANFFQLLD